MGVDALIDLAGGDQLDGYAAAVRDGGRVASVLVPLERGQVLQRGGRIGRVCVIYRARNMVLRAIGEGTAPRSPQSMKYMVWRDLRDCLAQHARWNRFEDRCQERSHA